MSLLNSQGMTKRRFLLGLIAFCGVAVGLLYFYYARFGFIEINIRHPETGPIQWELRSSRAFYNILDGRILGTKAKATFYNLKGGRKSVLTSKAFWYNKTKNQMEFFNGVDMVIPELLAADAGIAYFDTKHKRTELSRLKGELLRAEGREFFSVNFSALSGQLFHEAVRLSTQGRVTLTLTHYDRGTPRKYTLEADRMSADLGTGKVDFEMDKDVEFINFATKDGRLKLKARAARMEQASLDDERFYFDTDITFETHEEMDVVGKAQKLLFVPKEQRIYVLKFPEVTSGGNKITGDHMVIDLEKETLRINQPNALMNSLKGF